MAPIPGDIRLVVPDPRRNLHAHAFDELILAITGGLRRLGLRVSTTTECCSAGSQTIVLAPHLHDRAALAALPRESILYNWEPLGWTHLAFMTEELLALMREFIIWDYSLTNQDVWRRTGATRVVHVAAVSDPMIRRNLRGDHPDIDVLFYGSLNERRAAVLNELHRAGLTVKHLFGVYADERDQWIRRSRLVLNMHFHEGQILELPRLAYLWVNAVPVVCEMNLTTEDNLQMREACLHATYAEIVDRTISLLADPEMVSRSINASMMRIERAGDAAAWLRHGIVEAYRLSAHVNAGSVR
ncbi:hypothetical protein [Austwickia chelonae]|uniref:hypothetical protein n=1 Tax=Austwickia chelonae TaxID=100225 RepID=UPI000E250C85|nr:hypothetical protein [Austwickia chelonae]